MKKCKGLAAFCAVAFLLAGCSGTVDPVEYVQEETEETQAEGPVRPQDDFYRYVNGETLADAEFMYGRSLAANSLDDTVVREQLGDIIRDIASGSGYTTGTEEYVIQQVYNHYIDYDFENSEVPEDLQQLFEEIDQVGSVEELMLLDARIERDYGVPNIFNLSPMMNEHGQYDAVLTFAQIESVLNSEIISLSESYETLDNIRDNSSNFLQAIGHEEDEADDIGTALAYLVLDLYNASNQEELNERSASYFELYSEDQINEIITNVDIEEYVSALNIDTEYCDEFGVYDPGQLAALNDMLIEENLPALKALELGKLMSAYSDFVYQGYEELRSNAPGNSTNPEEDVLTVIMKDFGILLDPIYVEQTYTEEADEALRDMCEDIREQYRILITEATWLTEGTREGLLNKLDNMLIVTGMDVERLDPSVLSSVDCSSYYTLVRDYRARYRQTLVDMLSGPVPRNTIEMRMFEVNACYIPNLNSVTITVASASEPFFYPDGDYYENLGMLGATIGHEMGHAFDSNCILYDENGVYNPSWISPEDTAALEERNEQAVRYFEDNFIIFGIYHVDGEMTLGENYADLGGLESIVNIPETDEQRQIMFEAYARSWCMKLVDEALIGQIANDEHSPSWFRVNAMLSTLDAFYETYDVQEGDGMYIPPENRISRWH